MYFRLQLFPAVYHVIGFHKTGKFIDQGFRQQDVCLFPLRNVVVLTDFCNDSVRRFPEIFFRTGNLSRVGQANKLRPVVLNLRIFCGR
jgi:hypothetical protein